MWRLVSYKILLIFFLANEGNICNLPHERGNCYGYFHRWGFDSTTGKCVQFIYGGCGGNANNFETIEACEQKCQGKLEIWKKKI